MEKPTRIDYLEGRCSHREFYDAVLRTAGVVAPHGDAELKKRVRDALAAGDEHLNSIPPPTWDAHAAPHVARFSAALRAHGDFWSLAGGVCLMKEWLRRE